MLKVENGRLISDIAEMADTLRLEVFLVTVNIEKASHSVNHCFLISAPERFGFGTEFLKLIKTQLENWESCYGRWQTSKIFQTRRGAG